MYLFLIFEKGNLEIVLRIFEVQQKINCNKITNILHDQYEIGINSIKVV